LLRRVALLLALSPFLGIVEVPAQTARPGTIEIAPAFTLTPNIETPFPVRIAETANLPKRATLLIKGVPPNLTLTQGRVFDSGVWFVPATELPKLRILASSEAAGLRVLLMLTLVSLDGAVLGEGKTILSIGEPSGGQSKAQDPASTVTTSAEVKAPVAEDVSVPERRPANLEPPKKPVGSSLHPSVTPAEEAERLRSGQAALALDDVAAARLIFEYLAFRGSAQAAWHLAQSYDPQFLGQMTTASHAKSDPAAAAKWYARAAEMGHAEARKKLAGRR
jgi:hypothetical protein